jgi:hypothetical protein
MFSACPNGCKCDQGGPVLPQFRARYCGHTLSRLAEIRHNKTKQTTFPTVRRKKCEEFSHFNVALGLVMLYKTFFYTGCTYNAHYK